MERADSASTMHLHFTPCIVTSKEFESIRTYVDSWTHTVSAFEGCRKAVQEVLVWEAQVTGNYGLAWWFVHEEVNA